MFLSSFTMVVRIDFTGNRLYTTNTSQCWTWERLYNLWKSSKGIGREILTVMFQHLRASLIEGTKSEPHSSMLWTASKFTCKSWSIHDSKPTARPQDVKKSTKFQAKKGNLDQVKRQCWSSVSLTWDCFWSRLLLDSWRYITSSPSLHLTCVLVGPWPGLGFDEAGYAPRPAIIQDTWQLDIATEFQAP